MGRSGGLVFGPDERRVDGDHLAVRGSDALTAGSCEDDGRV
jgi:hypothetical protein